jgi:capsular polysaccharide biosynthesis protein
LQIHDYWEIIRRRLWLVGLLSAIALVGSGYTSFRGAQSYCSNMKLAVSVVPLTGYGPNTQYDPQYYATLTAEYLADDLTELIRSNPFAQYVSAEVGYSLDPSLIVSATRTKKTHRTIDLSVCGSNPGAVGEIGDAYARVINTRLPDYFSQIQAQNAVVRIINGPSLGRATSLAGMAAEILLRTVLGLALGIALAFLLHYLDDRLRERREFERLLGMPILAEIPGYEGAARR